VQKIGIDDRELQDEWYQRECLAIELREDRLHLSEVHMFQSCERLGKHVIYIDGCEQSAPETCGNEPRSMA
jgi:hypothetical protein